MPRIDREAAPRHHGGRRARALALLLGRRPRPRPCWACSPSRWRPSSATPSAPPTTPGPVDDVLAPGRRQGDARRCRPGGRRPARGLAAGEHLPVAPSTCTSTAPRTAAASSRSPSGRASGSPPTSTRAPTSTSAATSPSSDGGRRAAPGALPPDRRPDGPPGRHPRREPGDELATGERVGLMKFGSRMDVFVPPECDLLVSTGDTGRGGRDRHRPLGAPRPGDAVTSPARTGPPPHPRALAARVADRRAGRPAAPS